MTTMLCIGNSLSELTIAVMTFLSLPVLFLFLLSLFLSVILTASMIW